MSYGVERSAEGEPLSIHQPSDHYGRRAKRARSTMNEHAALLNKYIFDGGLIVNEALKQILLLVTCSVDQ